MSYSLEIPTSETTLSECVILLHGLGRTSDSMEEMQDHLIDAGFHTVNVDYPSREKTIEQLASEYIPPAIEKCSAYNPRKIHFVTHSLGGLIVRMALKDSKPLKMGRVVMLSPPNKGSEVVDELKDRWYFSWYNGPAGLQLSTAKDSVPNQLGPVNYPVGVITGNTQAFFDYWLVPFFQGSNDGKVSVERSKVEGMKDFVVVQESHPFIMNSEIVQLETIQFLKEGTFSHGRAKEKISN